MMIAFLINCPPEKQELIKKSFGSEEVSFICTENPEEVLQTGNQLGKVILCFSDSSFAYKFLKTNKFGDFKRANLLFMSTMPKVSEDASRKLRDVSLEITLFKTALTVDKIFSVEGEEAEIEFLTDASDGTKNAA